MLLQLLLWLLMLLLLGGEMPADDRGARGAPVDPLPVLDAAIAFRAFQERLVSLSLAAGSGQLALSAQRHVSSPPAGRRLRVDGQCWGHRRVAQWRILVGQLGLHQWRRAVVGDLLGPRVPSLADADAAPRAPQAAVARRQHHPE